MGALQNYPRITPFLWLDLNAEEGVESYLDVFQNSRRLDRKSSTVGGGASKGSVRTVAFELDCQKLTALSGGPVFKLTEAVECAALTEE